MRNILLGCHKNTKLILVWVWSCLGFLCWVRNKFLKTRERLCLSAVLKFEAFIAVRLVPNLASKSSASAFLLLFSSITLGDIALSQKRIFDFSIHQLKITLIIFRGEENYMYKNKQKQRLYLIGDPWRWHSVWSVTR